MLASFISDGKVSLNRVEEYMHAEELDFLPETEYLSDNSIVIRDGNFDWNTSEEHCEESTSEKNETEFIPSNPSLQWSP